MSAEAVKKSQTYANSQALAAMQKKKSKNKQPQSEVNQPSQDDDTTTQPEVN